MADDVEKIARGLSDPMRNAIAYGLSGYYDPNTIRALRRKGLVIGGLLTPLGLSVRSYLKDHEHG